MARITEAMKAMRRDREDQLMRIAQSVSPNDSSKQAIFIALDAMRREDRSHGFIIRNLAAAIIDYSRESQL